MKQKIDLFLLDKFQRVSDWAQDTFGITNFMIAKFLNKIIIFLIIARLLFLSLTKPLIMIYVLVGFQLLYIMSLFLILTNSAEESFNSKPIYQNPFLMFPNTRFASVIMFLFFSAFLPDDITILLKYGNLVPWPFSIASLCFTLMTILFFPFMYFGSCTPKPKKPSKIKKWLEKGVEVIKQIGSATQRQPMPAFSQK